MLGYFPAEYVRPLARHEVERSGGMKAQLTEHTIQRMIRPPSRVMSVYSQFSTKQSPARTSKGGPTLNIGSFFQKIYFKFLLVLSVLLLNHRILCIHMD